MTFLKKIILKLLSPILNRLTEIENKIAVNKGLSKGALGANIRSIDLNKPLSWEFSALSQNGEDGITDFLISYLIKPNKYFIEIGAGNGITSNTAWLALVKNYSGIMIDGVSIKGWKKLFKTFGYKFITVDSNGVNAFFAKEDVFNQEFINNEFNGLDFEENFFQKNKFKCNWEKQYKLIEDIPL